MTVMLISINLLFLTFTSELSSSVSIIYFAYFLHISLWVCSFFPSFLQISNWWFFKTTVINSLESCGLGLWFFLAIRVEIPALGWNAVPHRLLLSHLLIVFPTHHWCSALEQIASETSNAIYFFCLWEKKNSGWSCRALECERMQVRCESTRLHGLAVGRVPFPLLVAHQQRQVGVLTTV